MVKKHYDWQNGVDLSAHTKKKHEILREYFGQYLITRCQHPQQAKFRLAVVDGFAGGGLYKDDHYGSPLIFIDTLINTSIAINETRRQKGFKPLSIDCCLILNDDGKSVIDLLKKYITPLLVKAEDTDNLHIAPIFFTDKFEGIYSTKIKQHIQSKKTYQCILFFGSIWLFACRFRHN